ncbi:LuxR family transcriptional regulator [Myxococcus stipitatus DSM 14675]|uniref:LuxR family transcriptional regulator n=1 Tax=Myxococcus stipitatus (strain DSM 14675 / JCM 12634 / Mx s8) TaxID=1278073 RepID=L7U5C6_MYXSD|nr:LuxR C-terminal-related transcriptional regulator [Myxococcus stipitatus]AGC44056.1 LuxR family transcriptional regulator [Myxococcus stipitatus DSM 14675]
MFNPADFTSSELLVREKVTAALNSPFLPKLLEATRKPLLEFVQADSMALCIMRLAPAPDFRWHVPGTPIPILNEYAGLVEQDFLRAPILARPGVPVFDTQLLSRAEYEGTLIYQRSLELRLPFEHIMAVLVPISPGLVAALAFYRHERRPFTSQNAIALSSITSTWATTLDNCQAVQNMAAGAQLLQELYLRKNSAYLVFEPPAREVHRTPLATSLLERWFPTPSDIDKTSGLPRVLKERLDALIGMNSDARLGKNLWVLNHPEAYRTCRFVELPSDDSTPKWALLLSELPHSIPIPFHMQRKLTPRELDVARGVLRNWSNGQIADELEISGETVKTHVRNLFDKLGVDCRADFLYQVAHLNRPV